MRLKTPSFMVLAALLVLAAIALQVVLAAPAAKAPRPTARQSDRIAAEGRVSAEQGSDTIVGAELAGAIAAVDVVVNQSVRRGDVIARIRDGELRAAVGESEAHLQESESELRLTEAEEIRARELWKAGVGTQQNLDRAMRDCAMARARHLSAEASLVRLRAKLQKSVVRAPIDGIVVERSVDPGETVDIGSPVATIIDPRRVRIDAEVDEIDVARVRPGAPVLVMADGFDAQWRGRVIEIPMRVVGRGIRPADPSQPVDTRVLMVGVEMLESTPLKIGQRVQVKIGR